MKVILNMNVEDLEVLNHIYNMIDEEKYKISRMKHRKSNTKEDLDAFEKKLYECCAAGLLIDKIYWNAFNKLELLEEKKERKGRSNYRPCKDRDP